MSAREECENEMARMMGGNWNRPGLSSALDALLASPHLLDLLVDEGKLELWGLQFVSE